MSHQVPEARARRVDIADRPPTPARGDDTHPRGQVLIIFAFLLTILLGMAAFVVDLAWIWSNQLQVQRAADAGALAGVVHLPADPNGGIAAARAEARKNGYVHNVDAQIVASPDPDFSRRMIVTISAPVDTFFLGLFGFDEVTVTRTARAEYILPVPMGSPQNYLGVGRLTDAVTQTVTTTTPVTDDTNWNETDGFVSGGQWNDPDEAFRKTTTTRALTQMATPSAGTRSACRARSKTIRTPMWPAWSSRRSRFAFRTSG